MQQTPHILDNPIWHALNSGNSHLATGSAHAKYFPEEVTTFVGIDNFSRAGFTDLYDLMPPGSVRATFTPPGTVVPEPWQVTGELNIYQMIYEGEDVKPGSNEIRPLTNMDVPAMMELTKLTNPGPFRPGTIDFGNYHGIFESNTLVAMAGHRLKPYDYTEISAVCTHPVARGKGLAKQLLLFQIALIRQTGSIPILHVATTNDTAFRLYESIGFVKRRTLSVMIFRKSD